MKKHLRKWLIFVISLAAVNQLTNTLGFTAGIKTLLVVAAAFTVFDAAIKPVVKILLLPINLLTLGLARWVVNVVGLYLVTIAVPGFVIFPYQFPGFNYQGFIAPPFSLSLFWTYVLISFLLNLTFSLVSWILKK